MYFYLLWVNIFIKDICNPTWHSNKFIAGIGGKPCLANHGPETEPPGCGSWGTSASCLVNSWLVVFRLQL